MKQKVRPVMQSRVTKAEIEKLLKVDPTGSTLKPFLQNALVDIHLDSNHLRVALWTVMRDHIAAKCGNAYIWQFLTDQEITPALVMCRHAVALKTYEILHDLPEQSIDHILYYSPKIESQMWVTFQKLAGSSNLSIHESCELAKIILSSADYDPMLSSTFSKIVMDVVQEIKHDIKYKEAKSIIYKTFRTC